MALVVVAAIALVAGGIVLADSIQGGPGYEQIGGTPGDDQIDARDGGPDTIDCGAGNDTVTVDRSEDGSLCGKERVTRTSAECSNEEDVPAILEHRTTASMACLNGWL